MAKLPTPAATSRVATSRSATSSAATHSTTVDWSRLGDVAIPVVVQLGALRLTVSALAQLAPGQILPLAVVGDAYPQLVADNQVLASGVLVRRGQRLGLCLRRDVTQNGNAQNSLATATTSPAT